MADEFISVTLTPGVKNALNGYLKRKEGVISKKLNIALKESIEYIRQKMADYAPNESGKLTNTILSLPIGGLNSSNTSFSFTEDKKMVLSLNLNRRKDQQILWVDRGTGIYGPFGQPIVPTSGEFLYFEIDGRLIRTRSIKGQRGQHFIQRALNVSKLIVSSKLSSAIGA